MAIEGTYQFEYATRSEVMFQMFAGSIITTSDAFDTAAVQTNILATVENLQQSEWVSESTTIRDFYWLYDLLELTNEDGSLTPVTGTAFYQGMADWLGALGITSLASLRCTNEVNAGLTINTTDCSLVAALLSCIIGIKGIIMVSSLGHEGAG